MDNTTTAHHPIKRLWRYKKRHRRRVLMATLCSFLNKVFDLAPPALIGAAVDIVVEREESLFGRLGLPDLNQQLILLAALTVLVWMLESVFEYALNHLWRNLAQTVQHEMRVDTYSHVQRLDMAYFDEQSTGGLMAILNDDINQLELFLNGGANDLIQVGTTVVIISGAFFMLAPGVAWLALLPIPLIIWGSFKYQDLIAPRYAEVRERVALLNGQLANNLTGIATIKSFTAEEHEVRRLSKVSEDYVQSNARAITLNSGFSPIIRMAIVIGFTGTLIYGGQLTLAGDLAVGSYSVMVFLTQRLLWPLTRLGSTFDLYQRAMASTSRVMNLLHTPIQRDEGKLDLPADQIDGRVCFEDVTFGYEGRDTLFHQLQLTIDAGQTIGIVGSTGSGKSSLVKLLMRLYEVTEGRVTIDGHDIHDMTLSTLRRAIGLVSQGVFLFHGTVRENIAYGSFDASDEEIERAAQLAEAHDFITALPQGYDTVIGERGQKLSGGQRQRLSIARAILKDPPILILDEATSAVDNETEAAIQRSMERIAQGRTTLIIAHRLSTVRNADTILVLEHGRLKEQGRHEELLAQEGGIYTRLWQVQTGDRAALDAA
ncbi:MAG: ABC transporter [Myxococcales bacterium]|nr:ABC transporter [Myxococcales bacterium]